MTGPDLRPEAVEAAAAWIVEHHERYSPDGLGAQLLAAGYSDAEVAAARAEAERRLAGGAPRGDLRARAAAILIVAFLGTWGILSWLLVAPRENTYGPIAAGILAMVLAFVALLSLAVISQSRGLKRGAQGALVTILAVPFVLLVIVAGLCLATTGNALR
jgi:hypothetical protein